MKTSLQAGASKFAHFAGLSRAARADDDKPGDDTDTKAAGDEEDEPEKDEPKAKKAKNARAEEDDDDKGDDKPEKAKASEDDDDDLGDDEEPKAKKSKKARAADDDDDKGDDDDDKSEMSGKSAVASARRRERARCAAIFASPAAAANIPLAASLAFETTMTRTEAVAVMKGQVGREPTRSSRASRNPDLGAGYDAPSGSGASKPDAVWDRAFSAIGIKKTGR